MLIDTHAHLHVKNFDADRDQTIARARLVGVSKIINVGFDVEENFQALALARKYDFIYATMGIHPHLASQWSDDVGAKILEAAKKEGKIVALGEMGLDFFKNFQPAETQKTAFAGQLKLAAKLRLPVIIHCRDAFDETLKILLAEKIEKAVFHCFTGTEDEAAAALSHGFYLGFTGVITYKSAEKLRRIVQTAPANRLLFETDCPYLAPQKFRGQRNEPAFVSEVYKLAARLRNADEDDLQNQIQRNACDFFALK